MYKEIIVLAKSYKRSEYCIAGVDTSTGNWIRPISNNVLREGSVPLEDIIYSDGSQVQVLDKVKIKMLSHNPTKAQPENYIYDKTKKWLKTGTCSLDEVIKFRGYDNTNKIFSNTRRDVLESELGGQGSLLFLNVQSSYIFIKTFVDGKKKLQFNFKYNNLIYKYLTISDIVIKDKFESESDGVYDRRDNLPIVISLTDKYEPTGKYYKMVAQLFYN